MYHHNQDLQENVPGDEAYPYQVPPTNRTEYAPPMVDGDPSLAQYFQNSFLDFFNTPYGEDKPMEEPYAGQSAFTSGIAAQDPCLAMPAPDAIPSEPERPFAMALTQSILARAWTLPLDNKAQEEISANLTRLLTTARIRKFIALYFKNWQPSCPMIHVPSFDPETVPLPLLAAVVFMGAIYSHDLREVYMAKRVIDFAELYIFSTPVFSAEHEVVSTFLGGRDGDEENDWIKFQNFQAGFIIILVQFWSGNTASRMRAMEGRFSLIVKVN